jgi:iron complex outermembrane receptor protein
MVAVAPLGAATVEAKQSFDLPRGDAATTLRQFAASAGRSLVFVTDKVRGETTNSIRGEFTPREALERMLAGSALEATQDSATGALVVGRKRPAERKPRNGEVGSVSDPQPKPKTKPMKSPRPLLAAVAGWLAASTAVDAQTTAPAGDVVKLSAFEVAGQAPNRYQASDATSGGRLRTDIFDSPQSISVVPEALLKDVAAVRTIDALKYIAGVTESTLPNGLDRVTVRGFQWDGQTVDGFYSNSYNNLDPFLLDRIEVVKGPNAIISPSGNPGGTVNHVTKKPLFVSPRHSARPDASGTRAANSPTASWPPTAITTHTMTRPAHSVTVSLPPFRTSLRPTPSLPSRQSS